LCQRFVDVVGDVMRHVSYNYYGEVLINAL